ncbi:hypothetical protein SDC9_191224 [bioreactor metagenome]|uniref:Uncharacterized protein n=1 Tax=bioreactor metagenome TaxID=1076179 RepID=A0A645I5G7_9ZZZZ
MNPVKTKVCKNLRGKDQHDADFLIFRDEAEGFGDRMERVELLVFPALALFQNPLVFLCLRRCDRDKENQNQQHDPAADIERNALIDVIQHAGDKRCKEEAETAKRG